MGFWDGLGGVLKAAGEGFMESGREYAQLKMEYRSYSDDRLARLWWTGKYSEKTAAYTVLKERHGVEGAKELINRAR